MKPQGKGRTLEASREGGVVAMEFVLLFPLFFLILAGIVEFGHLWYVRHTLTNATREGARAAVVYYVQPDSSAPPRTTWATDTAKATVDKYLQDTKFSSPYTVETTAGSQSGDLVTVTLTAPNGLLVLDSLVPAFQNLAVSAETSMKME